MSETALAASRQQAAELAKSYDYGTDTGAGFGNVTTDDLALPFLSILQTNSPEVSGEPAQRIEGAAAGLLINTVTNELFDPAGIIIQPVTTQHLFMEWRPRLQGGGMVGAHSQTSKIVADAKAASADYGKYKTPNGNDLAETVYLLSLVHRSADIEEQLANPPEPIIVAFNSTKLRPYKALMYRLNTFRGRPPLFAHRILVSTFQDKNPKGLFYNFKLTAFVNDDIASSLIPPTLDGKPHPLLLGGRELEKASQAGLITIKHDSAGARGGTSKGGGGEQGGQDDIPF